MGEKRAPKELWINATPSDRVWYVYTSERTARRGLLKGDLVLRYILAAETKPTPKRKRKKP